jgi:hypothetical protein
MVKGVTKDEYGVISTLAVEDGQLVAGTHQDVEPILEANKAQYNNSPTGWKGDIHHVARIPEAMVSSFLKEFNCTYRQLICDPEIKKKLIAKLNSNDYRFLRTRPGRLGWQ